MTASLTVADVMHKPAVVVPTSITLAEASVILDGANVGAAAVLADERVSFASTLPAAAIRRLPQRAMSST